MMYAFAPEKTPSLAGRNFCLAILQIFGRQPFYPLRGASLQLFFQFLFPLSGEILSKRNRSSIFPVDKMTSVEKGYSCLGAQRC
jgi:hypothetical protein